MADRHEPLPTIGELISSGDFASYFSAPGANPPHILRQLLSTPDRLLELIRVAGPEDLDLSPERLTRISFDQLRDVQRLCNLPDPEWRKLIEATATSPAVLDDAIRTLRNSRGLASVDWDALLDASSPSVQSPDPAGQTRTGWLSRLSTPQQVALLVAVLTALNELTKLLENLTHHRTPEDLEPAVAVVLAAAMVLLIVLDAKTKPPD